MLPRASRRQRSAGVSAGHCGPLEFRIGVSSQEVSGTFLNSEYTGGTASEQFTFRIQGDRALLAGYHVNSRALVVK
jgi:hypothetical protein